eukprot:6471652-Amphidinium_carterae.1
MKREKTHSTGFAWNQSLEAELKDGVRWPPLKRAYPLPLDRVAALEVRVPLVAGGPAAPIDGILVVSWWMLREVGMSCVRLGQVSFEDDEGCGVGVLALPVLETDPTALGERHGHGCSCPSKVCPVATLQRLALLAGG